MELNIKLTDEEIKEAVLAIVAKRIAEDLDVEKYSSLKYVTRKEVKAVVRDLLKEHMDELADRAVCDTVNKWFLPTCPKERRTDEAD